MALPTTGLTLHVDASDTDKLFTTYVSGGPHTGTPTDGSSVAVWEDETTTGRIFKQGSINPLPVWRTTTPLMLLSCIDFTSGQQHLLTNNVNVNRPLSEIITNNACTVLLSFYAESITTSINTYSAHCLIADGGGYWGIHLSLVSGVPNVLTYNYDGSQDYVRLPVTENESHVIMMRHQSGILYASLDGGAESSIASGNTGSVANGVFLGSTGGANSFYNGRIGEVAVYNIALTGTDLTDAIDYFMEKWITGPPVTSSSEKVSLSVSLG